MGRRGVLLGFVFFFPLLSWLQMIPAALGPSVKGVCGAELKEGKTAASRRGLLSRCWKE